jgi:hypothetical protein
VNWSVGHGLSRASGTKSFTHTASQDSSPGLNSGRPYGTKTGKPFSNSVAPSGYRPVGVSTLFWKVNHPVAPQDTHCA